MKQFRNKGWEYFEKVQAMGPTTAKGRSSYSVATPAKSAPPNTQPAISSASTSNITHLMDPPPIINPEKPVNIQKPAIPTSDAPIVTSGHTSRTSTSGSEGKQKFASLNIPSEDEVRAPTLGSGSNNPPPPSAVSTASLGLTQLKTSISSKKKKTTGAQSIPATTLVGFGMQSSLNRFTDVFE